MREVSRTLRLESRCCRFMPVDRCHKGVPQHEARLVAHFMGPNCLDLRSVGQQGKRFVAEENIYIPVRNISALRNAH